MDCKSDFYETEILPKYGQPDGPNCAECVLLYGIKCLDIDLPDDFIRIATPFGGGMGRCEDTCGTLIAGMILIGLKYGRRELSEDKMRPYAIAKEFYNWFNQTFNSSNCKDLNYSDFFSQDHRDRCGGVIVKKSVDFLEDFFQRIDNNQWEQPRE